MKTIKQTQEINFNTIEIEDAIILLPLMNALKYSIIINKTVNFIKTLSKEEQQKYNPIYKEDAYINFDNIEDIYNVLKKLGFIDNKNISIDDILNRCRK